MSVNADEGGSAGCLIREIREQNSHLEVWKTK